MGRGRSTRYALAREVVGVGTQVPVFRVGPEPRSASQVAVLRPIAPSGFTLEPTGPLLAAGVYPDLPWFLGDLRPSGFLGRLIPRRHPELGLPADIELWSAEHTLRYLVRFGWDLPGDLIVGEEAFGRFAADSADPPNRVERADREVAYGQLPRVALAPALPTPAEGPMWEDATLAAVDFWSQVADHPLITAGFRQIAAGNRRVVEGLADVGAWLPPG